MIPIAKPLVGEEEIAHVGEVLRSGQLTHGPVVEEFERELAKYCQFKHAIAVSSGTSALHLALLGLQVKPKDEVVVPDFTFIATANAAHYVHAKIKFLDVDKKQFTLDPKKAAKHLAKKKTKVILPVSLYGQPYDVDALVEAAHAAGAHVVSDNAQSIGAEWKGRRNWGEDVATLSFYPTKNMTTTEGGAVLTDNDELAERMRIIRNVGMRARYEYLYVGYNYRMTSVAAAVGLEQLKKLDAFTAKRRANAKMLDDLLHKVKPIDTPWVHPNAGHVYHQYTIKAERRDELKAFLDTKGIGSAIFYPAPIHSLPVYNQKASCPVTEKICKQVISLPVHPALTENDLHQVADAVKEFYASK